MKRYIAAMLGAMFVLGTAGSGRADDKDATAIVDKAIKAIGGEEKLGKIEAFTWKAKGKITFGESENEFTSSATSQGLDLYRGEFEGEFNGNAIKGVTVINGNKGWRKFGDNMMELDENGVANEKRNVAIQLLSATLVPLKGKDFKLETAGEEKVGDKPAAVVKVTPKDGKEIKFFFDKESGLLVKTTATASFGDQEFTQETTYADYKDFGGIKKATKVENKRDGNKFLETTVTEFKVIDKPAADTFAEPK